MAGAPIVVSAAGLWKTYKIHPPGSQGRWWRRPTAEYHALRGVDLELEEGSTTGIVGPNGAGKSTLLRILSRITDPTRGRAEIRGHVVSLLEVGTGFHPELTGRENVYLNAAIHGLGRRATRARLDDIVAFAEIGPYLDEPVKRYSSGMYLRLAFSIAAHLEPDILILDEVLAVGDAAFRERCLARMRQVASDGRTVIMVGHEPSIMRALCRRGIWLDHGEVRAAGDADDVLTRYVQSVVDGAAWVRADTKALRLRGLEGAASREGPARTRVRLAFDLEVLKAVEGLYLDVGLEAPRGERLLQVMPASRSQSPVTVTPGQRVRCVVEAELPALAPGEHTATLYAHTLERGELLFVEGVPAFSLPWDPAAPESVLPSFSAVLTPPYTSTVTVEGAA